MDILLTVLQYLIAGGAAVIVAVVLAKVITELVKKE
jgi:hypothetical protein